MMLRALLLLVTVMLQPAFGDTVVAARTIRAQEIIAPGDVTLVRAEVPGGLERVEEAVGLEARVVLYAGRPVRQQDLGPPAIIKRNAIVTLMYRRGGLTITAEGRALGRAGIGDMLRVMNLASRNTVTGTVLADGSVRVGMLEAEGPVRRADR